MHPQRNAFVGWSGGECSLKEERIQCCSVVGEAPVPFTEDAFIPSLAAVLQHLVSNADSNYRSITPFHAVSPPAISVAAYVNRVARYFGCSNECFVLALVYIDRIIRRNPSFRVCLRSIHRLLLAAVMIAAKFFDDTYYSNRHYAKVGGVRVAELNVLETQFLSLLAFDLFVHAEEYNRYRVDVLAAFAIPSRPPALDIYFRGATARQACAREVEDLHVPQQGCCAEGGTEKGGEVAFFIERKGPRPPCASAFFVNSRQIPPSSKTRGCCAGGASLVEKSEIANALPRKSIPDRRGALPVRESCLLHAALAGPSSSAEAASVSPGLNAVITRRSLCAVSLATPLSFCSEPVVGKRQQEDRRVCTVSSNWIKPFSSQRAATTPETSAPFFEYTETDVPLLSRRVGRRRRSIEKKKEETEGKDGNGPLAFGGSNWHSGWTVATPQFDASLHLTDSSFDSERRLFTRSFQNEHLSHFHRCSGRSQTTRCLSRHPVCAEFVPASSASSAFISTGSTKCSAKSDSGSTPSPSPQASAENGDSQMAVTVEAFTECKDTTCKETFPHQSKAVSKQAQQCASLTYHQPHHHHHHYPRGRQQQEASSFASLLRDVSSSLRNAEEADLRKIVTSSTLRNCAKPRVSKLPPSFFLASVDTTLPPPSSSQSSTDKGRFFLYANPNSLDRIHSLKPSQARDIDVRKTPRDSLPSKHCGLAGGGGPTISTQISF